MTDSLSRTAIRALRICVFALATLCASWSSADEPSKGAEIFFDGKPVESSLGTAAGSRFYYSPENGSQAALFGFDRAGVEQQPNYRLVVDLEPGTEFRLALPESPQPVVSVSCRFRNLGTLPADMAWQKGDVEIPLAKTTVSATDAALSYDDLPALFEPTEERISLVVRVADAAEGNSTDTKSCALEIADFTFAFAPRVDLVPMNPERKAQSLDPVAASPNFRPAIERAFVEWDWKMQDGIGTEREPRTYRQALEQRLPQGRALIRDLRNALDEESLDALTPFAPNLPEEFDVLADRIDEYEKRWSKIEEDFAKTDPDADANSESLWREMRELKREILVNAPFFKFGKLLFVKHAPGIMSHQLTQVYGYCARPGGGIFVLDEPGKSMATREITPKNLPLGSFMTPEISYDAKSLYFAFCAAPDAPKLWRDPESMARRFHLYKADLSPVAKGEPLADARQLTNGDNDDFAPVLLPDGDLVFCSTRRGGFHRCGGGPCQVYTLARSKGDGSNAEPISFHETNEWFPVLAHNGRVVYTRWDYVDRDAVYYQQLWSARQDGSDVRILYGNNTLNPPGFWEPKAVPGSERIMAVGGPHHAMSAGSVVLIDPNKGVDGSEPIERLTPEARYPEGEAPLPMIPQLPTLCDFDYAPQNYWQATRPADRAEETPEERRWGDHVFKSPFPLSEKYFVASYSFDKLLGEAGPNIPNQFGIYFCDAFGNRELVCRDPGISSLWAVPIRPRPAPPVVASALDETRKNAEKPTGLFFLQNVYESWPAKIPAKIKALRIVQVLPKTTPNANQPMVGTANASPGKQVLGTVPVEEDGSAFFEVPARTPVLFQALDEDGRMVQGMRSLTYLQPGETEGCAGCHEDRMASASTVKTIASTREPSRLQPGPDGSRPLSYPILMQPVLDRLCVECHGGEKTEGGVNLTGEIDGHYTKSYNALVKLAAITYWGAPEGNCEPMTEPDRFGARASKLTELLEKGHYGVSLRKEDWERVNTWLDTNALFYGTFKPEDQERQQRGERIEGPALE